jgi:hypothetical protein
VRYSALELHSSSAFVTTQELFIQKLSSFIIPSLESRQKLLDELHTNFKLLDISEKVPKILMLPRLKSSFWRGLFNTSLEVETVEECSIKCIAILK